MHTSASGHSCELATRVKLLNPLHAAQLGEACLVEARKNGLIPDMYGGPIRRLGNECITHCLASRVISDPQG